MEALTTGQKKVWTGSEQVMGYIVALGLLFGVGYGLYIILPFLITLITNIAIFVGMTVALSVLAYVIISNRKMISVGYQIIIKKVWKALINSNPIAIMEIQYDNWARQKEKLNQNIITLKASREELVAIMDDNKDVANTKFKEAQKAQELATERNSPEYTRQANNNAIKAQRRVESNKMFLPKLQAIETALNYCQRVFDSWTGDLELLKDDINMKKRDLKVLSRTNGVFEMAKSYISGNSNERVMYEEATQAYAEQVSMYVANIKRFTDQTKDWVFSKDIQEAINTEEGQKYLSMYDETSFNKLTDFRNLMEDNNNVTFVEASNKMGNLEASTFIKSNTNFDQLR
jgi:hypothetical protein